MKAKIIKPLPGPRSEKVINVARKLNGGWSVAYPFVHSKEGQGCYFKDVDGNTFLDFSSQLTANPLGYNHPDMKAVIKQYANHTPIKFAGQDFLVKEHADLLEELLAITPRKLNAAFFVNSGAEAVENCLKVCMRHRKRAKYTISFENAFHGRTLGALSHTNSKAVHKKHFLSLPVKRLPKGDGIAVEELQRIIDQEINPEEIACIILEHVQGEGGYYPMPKKMVKEIRTLAKRYNIPYIADEVQGGMGRTGEWWSFQNYSIEPDVMSSAKALGVGAAVANKKLFPTEAGSLSSTWGGGHIIDMAMGVQTIKSIKRRKLLQHTKKMGNYVDKRLHELQHELPQIQNPRGFGLMRAFDLPTVKAREDVILGALQRGLVLLGCGEKGVRVVPPLIVTKQEIDEGLNILEETIKYCSVRKFKHTGKICQFVKCSESHT